jgi:PAS domain S-box-containing protein
VEKDGENDHLVGEVSGAGSYGLRANGMTRRDDSQMKFGGLRGRAEEVAGKNTIAAAKGSADATLDETHQLLYELQVHQIELEMQNEELRRAQLEVLKARERYFDLFDIAPVGYCTVSLKGLILEANLTTTTMLEVPRQSLTRQPLSRFLWPQDQEIYHRHLSLLVESGAPQIFEVRMLQGGGAPLWVEMKAVAAVEDDGVPIFRLVISDIGARKRSEELLRAKEAAVAAEAAKSRFLLRVAHEFRNPLSLLSSSLDILERYQDHLNRDQRRAQETQLRGAARQLKELVDAILCYNQTVPEEHGEPHRTARLQALVREVIAGLGKVRHPSHAFVVDIAPDCADRGIDEILFRRLLETLLTNAFQFTPPGRGVVLKIAAEGSHLLIDISDQGVGISSEDQQHVFSPFFRGQNVGAVRGFGLGLSIARDAVLQMGGRLDLTSAIGSGTRIRVTLPYAT